MRKPHAAANKADPIADALEALTGHEWRKRNDRYECRVNRTHANNIEAELIEKQIPNRKELSEARSGRYFVTVAVADGQLIINAADKLPKDEVEPRMPKKYRD